MTTLRPAAMHCSACAICFCGSLSALLIESGDAGLLEGAFIAGASNCTQRTDDFVSGSRTQTWTFVAVALPSSAGHRQGDADDDDGDPQRGRLTNQLSH